MSKLSDFLDSKKIARRRLLSASKKLEALTPADRSIRMARKKNRAGEASDDEKTKAGEKPRSGRPVTPPTLDRAIAGKAIPSNAKTRIVRAVNRVLEQKKQEPISIRELF